MQASVQGWAATLDDATVVALAAAVDPTLTDRPDGRIHHPTVVLGIPISENTTRDAGLVYVATPPLLDYLAIDTTTVDAGTTMLTSQPGEVEFTGNISREAGPLPKPVVHRIEGSSYSSVPDSLITEHGLDSGGWEPTAAGWLIESSHPITGEELSAARDMAAASGLTIEARDPQSGLSTLRTAATGIGIAVALAILAMTVGLDPDRVRPRRQHPHRGRRIEPDPAGSHSQRRPPPWPSWR